jgi:hypothetical protein
VVLGQDRGVLGAVNPEQLRRALDVGKQEGGGRRAGLLHTQDHLRTDPRMEERARMQRLERQMSGPNRTVFALLAGAVAALVAGAAPTHADDQRRTGVIATRMAAGPALCPPRDSIRSLFPAAKALGFSKRGPVTFQEARSPVWPGRCVGWWAEYSRIGPGGLVQSYVDVSVTLYRTKAQALVALREPAYTSTRILSDGARARIAWDGSGVASVIRNVFISSQSSHLPTDTNGIPDFRGGPDIGIPLLMKIHRGIHKIVLGRR